MVRHTLTLRGPACQGERPSPDAIGPVLSLIKSAVQQTIRMGFLHSSRMAGRPPSALADTWDIRFVGLGQGPDSATQLHFESPMFGEAAAELYAQTQLWEDAPAETETGFDLFGATLADIAGRDTESSRFDPALLGRVVRFGSAFGRGVESIEIAGHNVPAGAPAPRIGPDLVQTAKDLISETPLPTRVRVQGSLDMIRVSDCAFELVLKTGARVRCVWMPKEVIPLAGYLDKGVVVEGEAVFRPSGSLLRLDAEAITISEQQDGFFSEVPRPTSKHRMIEEVRVHQTARTGMNAVIGAWPGEESIDELLEALEAVGG